MDLASHGGAEFNLAGRQALEHGISMGRGSVWLKLTREQYVKLTSLETRAPRNVLIVATANKLARIAWAVLATGQDYRAVQEPVAA